MTTDRDFKDIVHARMSKTGEAYAAARAKLTRPAQGERFETGTTADGTKLFCMWTKLQTPEKGWSGLAIPSALLHRRSRAWLRGLLNSRPFWASAQPMGDGNHWLTVNRQMRAEMGLVGDEEVEALFVIADGPPAIEVPAELQRALDGNPAAQSLFVKMSHNHRKEYANWVAEAKQAATRDRRSAQAMERILTSGGKIGV